MADFKELREALAAVKRAPTKFDEGPARERLRWSAEAYAEELLAALDAAEARARELEGAIAKITPHPTLVAVLEATRRERDAAQARVRRLEAALREARDAIRAADAAENKRGEAASACVDQGLIERQCADDCPQDDTCDCPETQLIGAAINGTLHGLHIGDLLRRLDAALADGADKDGGK